MAKENVTVIGEDKKEVRDFGWRDLVGYFMGDFGCNMSFTLISSYMFIFYTQYIGISLSHYAIIILITKILDGINDPLIGALVDKLGANKLYIKKHGKINSHVFLIYLLQNQQFVV